MCKNKTRCWMVLTALVACMPLWADNPQDEIKKVLSACADDQAVVVARLDLARIDVDAAFDLAERALSKSLDPEAAGRVHAAWQEHRRSLGQRVTKLRAAGAKSLYVLWGPQDLSQCILAVPLPSGASETALNQAIGQDWPAKGAALMRKADVLVVGAPSTVERLKGNPRPPGPQWGPAVERATDAAMQVFLAPSEDNRRILEEMLPGMFGQQIQVPDHAISKGLQWAALSLDWPPRLAVRLYVQSADPASAQALGQLMAKSLDSAAQAFGPAASQPGVAGALARLVPEVADNALRLTLDTQQSTSLLEQGIGPVLVQMDRRMAHSLCMRNLRTLGMAMAIWANDNADKMPPNLEIVIKETEGTPRMLRCDGNEIGEVPAPYVYRGKDLGLFRGGTSLILAHDPKGCHQGGRCVVLADVHSEWLTEEQFQKRIEEDNRARRQAGLPEKPAE